MFDETKGVWIKIFKVMTILSFLVLMLTGLIGGIIGIAALIDGYEHFMAIIGVATFVVAPIVAFVILAINMLALNFLQNVQIIRTQIVEANNNWQCSCGQTNTGAFCGNCGKPKP